MTRLGRSSRSSRTAASALAAAMLGVVFLPAMAGPAQACSCVGLTDARAYEAADAVFVGQVETITDLTGGPIEVWASNEGVSATVMVDTVYKGSVYERTPVRTAADGSSCGAGFEAGVDYAVFASYGEDSVVDAGPNDLVANLCNGTRPLDERPLEVGAQTDVGWWTGVAPMDGEPASENGFPLLGWLSYVAVAGLGLMPLALWIRFRAGNRSAA